MESTDKHAEQTAVNDGPSEHGQNQPAEHKNPKAKKKPALLVVVAFLVVALGASAFMLSSNSFNAEQEQENEENAVTLEYCQQLGDSASEDSPCEEFIADATSDCAVTGGNCPETTATLGVSVGDFQWPVKKENWPITASPIVNCDMIYSDNTLSTGIELAVPEKTKVYAVAGGKVKVAEMRNGYAVVVIDTAIPSSAGGGKTVRINYNYLLDLVDTIKPGVTVQTGQYLAVTGKTPADSALKGKPGMHFGIWKTTDADGVVSGHVPYFANATATTMSQPAKDLAAKLYHPLNFMPDRTKDNRNISDCPSRAPGNFYVPGSGTNILKRTGTTPTPTPTKPAFVFYSQLDPRWKNHPYPYPSGRTIGSSGCGPTSLAIAISSVTGKKVMPVTMADWSRANGYRVTGVGTSRALYTSDKAEAKWGYRAVDIGQNFAKMREGLRNGGIGIATGQGYPPFGSGGHVITIRSVDSNGNFKVGDPLYPYQQSSNPKYNHANTNNITYSAESLRSKGGSGMQMWIVYKK